MIVDPTIALAVSTRAEHQEIDFDATLAEPLDPAAIEFWQEWLEGLCIGVTWGALADQTVPVGTARMQPLGPFEIHDQTLRAALDVDGVGASAWKVILNLLRAASACSTAISALRIASRQLPAAPLTARAALAAPYPPARAPLPFVLLREDPADPTRQRSIRLEFAREVTEAESTQVTAALLAWIEFVNGGYPGDGQHPMENACDARDPSWLLPNTVQCELPNYLGVENGFDALVNMAVTFHRKLCPLSVLSID
jgi:hypothetical protein